MAERRMDPAGAGHAGLNGTEEPMRPPSSRLRGRSVLWKTLLIAAVAFIVLPTFSTGNDNQVLLRAELMTISRSFQKDVGVIQANLSSQFRELPKVINDSSVPGLIMSIGNMGYEALEAYEDGYEDALDDVRDAIQFYGISADDGQQLRGIGGCTDRMMESWLWGSPTSFSKGLAMTLRRPRINVEYFDNAENEFVKVPLTLSSQVFPHPKDRLIFTGGSSLSQRLRIQGIVGGSFTRFNESDANTTACVFGTGSPGWNVMVTATGLGGPFIGNDTADSNGKWDLCLPGLKHGYYQFEADDGSRDDTREQGFLRQLRFTF